jgi:hypothetical protein
VFQPNQNCWAAIIFGQVELLSNKSNQWRSVRLLFGEGVLETSHDENMPLTVKKRRRKKEKKNTKTFTFTTLLNHVILRDDQPILMIDLRTI